jgi:threonine synthase
MVTVPAALPNFSGGQVWLKREDLQPAGSFLGRVALPLVQLWQSHGVARVIGQAGASLAMAMAWAAKGSNLQFEYYLADSAELFLLAQLDPAFNHFVDTLQPPSDAAEQAKLALRKAQRQSPGVTALGYAERPLNLLSVSGMAVEIVHGLGQAPAAVVVPCGQGVLLLGLALGFEQLLRVGKITRMPAMFGVQAQNCAPLWAYWQQGRDGMGWVHEGSTLASGVRVLQPVRGDTVLAAVQSSGGEMLAATELQIVQGQTMLAKLGIGVAPTTALVWHGIRTVLQKKWDGAVLAVL